MRNVNYLAGPRRDETPGWPDNCPDTADLWADNDSSWSDWAFYGCCALIVVLVALLMWLLVNHAADAALASVAQTGACFPECAVWEAGQ